MSVNLLPSITESVEADSRFKQNVIHIPTNQQLLHEHKKPQSATPLNKSKDFETISNKPEVTVHDSSDVSVTKTITDTTYNAQNGNVQNGKRVKFVKRSANNRPWEIKLTKKELEELLPRNSHFSCHDKALREAGYISDELKKRTLERTERKQLFLSKLHQARNDTNNLEVSTQMNSETTSPESLYQDHSDVNDSSLKGRSRSRKKHDDLLKVEHKALTEYLKYVKENTNEYLEHLGRKEKSIENMAVRNLIKTAVIFQKGHHGVPYTTPTVRASHTLNPRFADPGLWQQLNRDVMGKQLLRKDSTISKLMLEHEKDAKADSEEPKTDYEKVLTRAEKWVKTVSTAQFLRARQEALKEVDEEDVDVTKWWVTMKKCKYIRQTKTSTEAGKVVSLRP